MCSYDEVTIDCAIVNGEVRHISEFENLKSNERPQALCQDCNTPLIYSYGDVKSHHFRHYPDVECSGGGEGITHYKAKVYFADVLKQTNKLLAFNKCSRCNSIGGDDILIEYDDVQLEYVYDTRKKADIGLIKDGKFCCGIEVFVSHRCELSKIAFHRNQQIPCLEINAESAFRWSVGKRLSPDAIYGVQNFVCVMCEIKQLEKTIEKPEKYEPINQYKEQVKELIKANLIGSKFILYEDRYGENFKITVEVIEWSQGTNQGKRLQVRKDFLEVEILCEVKPPYTEIQKELFRQKYNEFIDKLIFLNHKITESKWKS